MGERWNPTPSGWRPTPSPTPRPRGEALWRFAHEGRFASCELREDRRDGAGREVRIRQDGELIIGRRCHDQAEARYYAIAFRRDYARGGWAEP
jgi:hypothetical protein